MVIKINSFYPQYSSFAETIGTLNNNISSRVIEYDDNLTDLLTMFKYQREKDMLGDNIERKWNISKNTIDMTEFLLEMKKLKQERNAKQKKLAELKNAHDELDDATKVIKNNLRKLRPISQILTAQKDVNLPILECDVVNENKLFSVQQHNDRVNEIIKLVEQLNIDCQAFSKIVDLEQSLKSIESTLKIYESLIKESKEVLNHVIVEDDKKKTLRCPICLEGDEYHVWNLCGHVTCNKCKDKMDAPLKCAVCKRMNQSTLRLYLN